MRWLYSSSYNIAVAINEYIGLQNFYCNLDIGFAP